MIVGIIENNESAQAARRISETLRALGAVVADKTLVPDCKNSFKTDDLIAEKSQVIISVGGDGTFLRSAHAAYEKQIPILGVNLGKVGYLTEIETGEIDMIERVLKGDYQVETRTMLCARVKRAGREVYSVVGLNDVLVKNALKAKILDIELLCNKKPVGRSRADGIIAATSTGSTAYSLSAGGPVIDPNVSCISVVWICPHTLKSRPIIFSDSSVLEIKIDSLRDRDAFVSVDGRAPFELKENDVVEIAKAVKQTSIIRLKNTSFNETLNMKFSL